MNFGTGLLFLILLVSGAWAAPPGDACGEIRVDRRAPPARPIRIPIRNQDSAPNCYSHSAATMATAYLQASGRLGLADQVSAEALYARMTSERAERLDINTGRTCNAIRALSDFGVCSHERVVGAMRAFYDSLTIEGFQSEPSFQAWMGTLEAIYGRYSLPGSFSSTVLTPELAAEQICMDLSRELRIPRNLLPSLPAIAAAVRAQDPTVFQSMVTGQGCRQPLLTSQAVRQLPMPACENFDFRPELQNGRRVLRPSSEFEAELHRQLERPGALPVGIEYCAEALVSPDTNHIRRRDFRANLNYLDDDDAALENFTPSCGFHASVVIGRRRMPDGQCYFMVQNSYGESCDGYGLAEGYCDRGRIWVRADRLAANTFRIARLR